MVNGGGHDGLVVSMYASHLHSWGFDSSPHPLCMDVEYYVTCPSPKTCVVGCLAGWLASINCLVCVHAIVHSGLGIILSSSLNKNCQSSHQQSFYQINQSLNFWKSVNTISENNWSKFKFHCKFPHSLTWEWAGLIIVLKPTTRGL